MYQLPEQAQIDLKNSLVQVIVSNRASRLITTQLCVALANLALQFISWKNVLGELVDALGSTPETVPSLMEFLKVLPEEASSSRKLPISDEEYHERTNELLVQNAERVLELLLSYVNSEIVQTHRSLIFQSFNSWLREIDTVKVINSPLLDLIFMALQDETTFEPAVDCICSIVHETRDTETSMPSIQALYPRIVALRPRITECKNDPDSYAAYTRLFAEAGESWYVLIASQPKDFRGLVEAIAECTAFDEDLDVVKYTFYFWFILKTMIVLDKYNEARNELGDIYLTLVDVIIGHLEYPAGNETDLFEGDREEEEKFREFRHEMGDVLKDCCSVIGPSRALGKAFNKVVTGLQAQANGQNVPWQQIEAPLFSMRAMAREVDPLEDEILPQIMKLLVQLPEHEKIRYAATLVLGRYTLWTAKHPDYLEAQLNYITNGFSNANKDVISAAAQALKFFCQDCGPLLTNYVNQLYPFYEKVGSSLDRNSYYEVTTGIAYVVKAQPLETMLQSLHYFCLPICQTLLEKANLPGDENLYKDIADQFEPLNIFVEIVDVDVPLGMVRPISKFVKEVLPLVQTLLDKHGNSSFVAERCCKFVRHALFSCKTDLLDVLPAIAELLANHFQKSHFGCYLWVTGTVVRSFSREEVPDSMKNSVWSFAQEQIKTFFLYLTTINPRNAPDLIDDFFRLMGDVILHFSSDLISSDLFMPSFEASLVGLDMPEFDPVVSSLDYLINMLAYGSKFPPDNHKPVPENVRNIVVNFALQKGGILVSKLIINLIYSFPKDTFKDAEALLVEVTQLVPPELATSWVQKTLEQLQGLGEAETTKLLSNVSSSLRSGDLRRMKSVIHDFTDRYTRRNVTPRNLQLAEFSYTA